MVRREVKTKIDHDFFHLIYTYLEERATNNVSNNLKEDEDYQSSKDKEDILYQEYRDLDLTKEQRKIIEDWVDAVQNSNFAYTMVVFRMWMQYCFTLLMELADWI